MGFKRFLGLRGGIAVLGTALLLALSVWGPWTGAAATPVAAATDSPTPTPSASPTPTPTPT
ncbi:MAG: hypothetical protein J2P43_06345, partial [Candidatus Dormibacteraeota bacterium]|nr:hypothetical protein [Candidatus Dormibacteraeota bacterium]